jgi:hypothetical protein
VKKRAFYKGNLSIIHKSQIARHFYILACQRIMFGEEINVAKVINILFQLQEN